MGSEYEGRQKGETVRGKKCKTEVKMNGRRRKGWGRGEVALVLHFIPMPTLLGSLFTSTVNTHARTHT